MSLISDEFNGFEIKGPPIIIGGDIITIVCGASRANYISGITWTYPNENLNKHSKFINRNIKINIDSSTVEIMLVSLMLILNGVKNKLSQKM